MTERLKSLFAKGINERSALTVTAFTPPKKPVVCGRQLCFFAAFFLPVSKLLETPSLLARYAKGDMLAPAIFQFIAQALVLSACMFALSRLKKPLLQELAERFGVWTARIFCFLYAAYFLFSSLMPLLDLEKFVYAAFYDTAPTAFTFAPFFLLSGFFCVKGVKALARSADLSLFLFLVPFLGLIVMSVGQTDLSAVLPIFGEPFKGTVKGALASAPHFADVALFLPFFCGYRYQKGDGKKVVASYGLGAAFVLLFFAVFLGLYTSLAPREHYAFIKVAQYFPALDTVGRIDLIVSYFLTVVLLFYTCLPIFCTVEFFSAGLNTSKRVLPSLVLNVALLAFVFFFNQRYNAFAAFYTRAYPVFWLFSVLIPLLGLLLVFKKPKGGEYAR